MCLYPFGLTEQEIGFDIAADATEDPLFFDVATEFVLRFAKLGFESK